MSLDAGERESLIEAARSLGVALDSHALDRCGRFLDLLLLWNRTINLVGDKDPDTLIRRHVVDSMAGTPLLCRLGPEPSIADLGAGAGLPGVPLAIAISGARITLIESRRKRANFLRAVARVLPDLSLEVIEQRVDVITWPPGVRFDAVVSRATMASLELLGIADRIVRPGGAVLAYKGPSAPELRGKPLSHGRFGVPEVRPYRLPGDPTVNYLLWWQDRSIVSRET